MIYFLIESKLIVLGRYDGKSIMCEIDLNSTIPANDIPLSMDLNFCTHLICSDSSMNSTKGKLIDNSMFFANYFEFFFV